MHKVEHRGQPTKASFRNVRWIPTGEPIEEWKIADGDHGGSDIELPGGYILRRWRYLRREYSASVSSSTNERQ
jgi:hypothetical protein